MLCSDKMERAIKVARIYHDRQVDLGGVLISQHAIQVGTMLFELTYSEEAFIVGCLHDIFEDTIYSYEACCREFGDRVADTVSVLTHKPSDAYGYYIWTIANSNNLIALECKIIDLICNTNPRRATKIAQKNIRAKNAERYQDALQVLTLARAGINE